MSKIRIEKDESTFRVYINDLIHLTLFHPHLIGMQSYINTSNEPKKIYVIEFYYRHNTIVCDYGDRDLWEEILRGIDKELKQL